MSDRGRTGLQSYGQGVHRMPPNHGFGPGAVAALPTASAHYQGQFLCKTDGTTHLCKPDGSGGWRWEQMGGDDTYVNIAGDTMTGNLVLSLTNPTLDLIDASGAANDKRWILQSVGGTFYLIALKDDGTQSHAMKITRAAGVADAPTFPPLAGTGTRVVEASSAGLLSANGALIGVLINETVHSAATTNSVNGCFSATYENYVIEISNIATTGAFSFCLRMRLSGTDASGASSYFYEGWTVNTSAATGAFGGASTLMSFTSAAATFSKGRATIFVTRPFVAAETGINANLQVHYVAAGLGNLFIVGGHHNAATSYDGFTLLLAGAGNISCTTRVYGLRNTP